MSNFLYDNARDLFLAGDIDWEGDDFLIICLSGYTPSQSADQFITDLGGVTLGTPTALSGTAVLAGGIADCDDVSYPGVALGETIQQVVVAKDTGVSATSPLIAFIDTNSDTTPVNLAGDGSNISIIIPSVATRLFKL